MERKERERKKRGRKSQGVLSSSDVYVPAEKREEKGYVGDGTDLPHDGGVLPASRKEGAAKSLPTFQNQAVVQNPTPMTIRYNKPEIPQYGGTIQASSAQATRKPMPSLQGKAVIQAPNNPGIILQKKNEGNYGGMLEPAVVTAELAQNGGELQASEVFAEEKTMPSLRGKAEVQNPSDIGKMPRPISRIETPENMIAKAQTADKTGIIDGKAETKEEEKEQADEAKNVISSLDDMIKELEEERKRAKEEDQVAARRSRNMQLVSGISDALSALANLIGVSKGASHIELQGTTGPLAERFDALRKERKADIRDINNRLEQKLKERMEMQREFARDAESKRRWEAEFGFKKNQTETQNNQWQQTFDANQEERKQKADQWQKEYELRSSQIQTENELAEKRYEEAVRSNKANEANAYRNYSLALKKFQEEQKENEYSLSVDNETFKVSKYDLTNGTVDPLFNSLPDEFKALAKGDDSQKIDPLTGEVTYSKTSAPTLEAKLGAVTTYIQQNPDDENAQALANSLRKMAGKTAKQYPKKEQSAQQGTGKLDEFK